MSDLRTAGGAENAEITRRVGDTDATTVHPQGGGRGIQKRERPVSVGIADQTEVETTCRVDGGYRGTNLKTSKTKKGYYIEQQPFLFAWRADYLL